MYQRLILMQKRLILLLLLPLAVMGQPKRLQPGKMYEGGEVLFAPRFGFTSTVPAGWSGLLPRESEVFLLSAQTLPAQIYVFGIEHDNLNAMKARWEKGIDVDEDVNVWAKAASIQNGILSSEVQAKGPYINKSNRAYAVARCGESGACIACLVTMPAADFVAIKKIADEFITSAKFEKPSASTPYADFDWREFLTGKTLTIYVFKEKGSKETTVDLCADGSFSAYGSKKGIMKNVNPQYKGRQRGTWKAEGVGESGKLVLTFKKLPAIETQLLIRDEKIYANDERYFVAESVKCK